MKIKLLKILDLLYLCFLLLLNASVFAQDVISTEGKHERLKKIISAESIILDSLNNQFTEIVEKIDIEKNRTEPDEKKITTLMAESVILNNSIELKLENIYRLKTTLAETEKVLTVEYKNEIDSLQEKIKSVTIVDEGKKIENEILQLQQKLFYLSPDIFGLSYKPEKLINQNTNDFSNDTEKEIFKEYLTEALNEVNTRLRNIEDKIDEIQSIKDLQQRAEEFMEDVEMDDGISNIGESGITGSSVKAAEESADFSLSYRALAPQLFVYSTILNDLSGFTSVSENLGEWEYDSLRTELSMEDYAEFLESVREGLLNYKEILKTKLNRD